MKENEKLEFRGSPFMALIPFIIFIAITIALSFINSMDQNMMIAAGVIGLLIGMVFAKNIGSYWDTVLEGLGAKVGMTAVMLWLVVGIYGNILKNGHIVEGLVWLSVKFSVSGAAFTAMAFVFAALFAVATGSGFGTISTMSFILYPAGILLGSNPAVLAGAILSGAAFGDSIAPVSDTAIIASTSQEYTKKEGMADIGGTVKTRIRFVIPAAIIALALFLLFGGTGVAGSGSTTIASSILESSQNPKGLIMLIPTAVVIVLAVRKVSIYASLGIGVLMAIVIGLVAGLFTFADMFSIADGTVSGAIPEGVAGMTSVSIVLLLVVAMGNILIRSGCMDIIVNWLNGSVIKTPRGAEVAIFSLATVFSILIAAINTIANICVAPFINAIGKKNGLHPYRRANILAMTICSFPFFLPYGGCILLFTGGLSSMESTYPFLPELAPSDMLFTAFYSMAIWVVMLFSCITGWGRAYEGEFGEYVTKKEKKEWERGLF